MQLPPGARTVARSLARADAVLRARNGWSDYSSNRNYERAYVIAADRLRELDRALGPVATPVWSVVYCSARARTVARQLIGTPTLVTALAASWISPASALGVCGASLLLGLTRPAYFSTRDHTPKPDFFLGLAAVRTVLNRRRAQLPAHACTHPLVGPVARRSLAELDEHSRTLAEGLLPAFPGSVGELCAIATSLALPPAQTLLPRTLP